MPSSWSQDGYIKALGFAARAHAGQRLPGTDLPYLVHLCSVGMEVMAALQVESGLDGTLAVQCALLHDTIEDTRTTYEELEKTFGRAVADGVTALSKDPQVEGSLRLAHSLKRIRKQPMEVWLVKLADRISNLQPPPRHWTREKIAGYHKEAVQIHEALGGASRFLAARLRKKIEDYSIHTDQDS